MTVVSRVTVGADFGQKLRDAVAKLTKDQVLVGIPDETAERQPTKDEPNPPSNAVIGYVQELGDEELHIPPRPFLVPGVENAKDKIVERLIKAAKGALGGNLAAVDAGFSAVGLEAQNAVRAKITDGPFLPLSNKTLKARARRLTPTGKPSRNKRTKDAKQELANRAAGMAPSAAIAKPLIDTGELRKSITYVIRTKGK